MKKYLVVAWDGHYPDCGLENIRYQTDDFARAEKASIVLKSGAGYGRGFDHCEIVDSESFTVSELFYTLKDAGFINAND